MNNQLKIKYLSTNLVARCLAFLLLFALSTTSVHANVRLVKGYIISERDDTVNTTLAVHVDAWGRLNEAKLNHTVELPDSSGNYLNLTPDDIKGFGFSFKEKQYTYVSKPIDQEGHLMFVQPLVTGPNTTLFCYTQLYHQMSEEHFTFEKQDGSYICISSFSPPEQIQHELKSFFREDEQALSVISTCFQKRSSLQKDIDRVVREVNHDQQAVATRK
jgi:hypothetical protein